MSESADQYSNSFSSATQTHSTSVSTSSRDFTDATGTGSATPAQGNNFAATWAGAGDEWDGATNEQPSLDDLARQHRASPNMPAPTSSSRRTSPRIAPPTVHPEANVPLPSSPPLIWIVFVGPPAASANSEHATIGAPEDPAYFEEQMKWGRFRDLNAMAVSGESMTPAQRAEYNSLLVQWRLHQRNVRQKEIGLNLLELIIDNAFNPENAGLGNLDDILVPFAGVTQPIQGAPLRHLFEIDPKMDRNYRTRTF